MSDMDDILVTLIDSKTLPDSKCNCCRKSCYSLIIIFTLWLSKYLRITKPKYLKNLNLK